MSGTEHRYRTICRWTGSTAAGYEAYDRDHRIEVPPAADALALSGDPAFGGDPDRLNPEQLLVAAASSCQMLATLALAAGARLDVREYHDDAEGVMPEDDHPMRITRIVLKPRITLAPGPSEERVTKLVERAHELCFIANSLSSEVAVEPEIRFAEA